MIRKLEVEGLNNRVDGTWDFNEDLNVITGRNGSGKTTLLKLIWYLISGNIGQIISDIPLQSVSIETDSFSLAIEVKSDEGELLYQPANQRGGIVNFAVPLRKENHDSLNSIDYRTSREMSSLFFPSFRRIEGGFVRVPRYISDDEPIANEYDASRKRYIDKQTEILQDAMQEISSEISHFNDHDFIASISTHDIVTLLTEKEFDISRKTDEMHVELSEYITQKISDRDPSSGSGSILEDIQGKVSQVSKERESLFSPFSILGALIRDIFHYEGVSFRTGVTIGEEKEAIESDKLSAGEKQMLSFLCYNTFSENTAIFIDEPELSLHVDWQRLLLPTLLEQETGNQFFVATHSPFIYGKYPEREILLGEDRGGD